MCRRSPHLGGGVVAPPTPAWVFPPLRDPVPGHAQAGNLPPAKKKEPYKLELYEQMTYPGQRVQVDVKVFPHKCIADPELRLFQYTAINEFARLRFLAVSPEQSTYSSADFLKKLFKWYARRGMWRTD